MAKEPIAGQPDEYDVDAFLEALEEVIEKHELDVHVNVPSHILSRYLFQQAGLFGDYGALLVGYFNQVEETGNEE